VAVATRASVLQALARTDASLTAVRLSVEVSRAKNWLEVTLINDFSINPVM
jgi:hypothetical protein